MRWDYAFKAAITAFVLFAPAQAAAAPVFDGSVAGARDFSMFPFWQKVLSDVGPVQQASVQPPSLNPVAFTVADTPPVLPCSNERTCAPPAWLSFLDGLRAEPRLAQLQAVNQWANAKPYVDDWVNWHVSDYWETPGEFIAHGGDCEDYAITKYFSLVRLGFSPDDLRIVVVDDSNARVFHAVLAARLDGKTWLLDNLLPQMEEMSAEPQYTPVYSLNEDGWWMHSNPTIHLAGITIAAGPQLAAVETSSVQSPN
jgi:predicted transglutaminase-like cysteine proteinase